MIKTRYEKPQMKFVSLQNKETVADGNCWSLDSNNTNKDHKWIYDNDGDRTTGYAWFVTDGKSCGTNNTGIQYGHEDGVDKDGNTVDAYGLQLEVQGKIASSGNNELKFLFTQEGFSIS